MIKLKLINSFPFLSYGPETFQDHLKSIINHTARLANKRQKASKERAKFNSQFSSKPIPKVWSFRINSKGTPILTIRKRKPTYLHKSELEDLLKSYPDHKEAIETLINKKGIEVRNDS